jgi:hypothetical protein
MMGSATLDWPLEVEFRVASRVHVCRVAASSENAWLDVNMRFFGVSGNLDHRYHDFVRVVLRPLERDIAVIAERRQPPPVLDSSLARGLPASGDGELDELLREAIEKFYDHSPLERKHGLDKLWDAFERLKTLDKPGRKPDSIVALLDRVTQNTAFRQILEQEATALNGIGNTLQIRHYDVGTPRIQESSHIDYLFHRLFAFVYLALAHRSASEPSA